MVVTMTNNLGQVTLMRLHVSVDHFLKMRHVRMVRDLGEHLSFMMERLMVTMHVMMRRMMCKLSVLFDQMVNVAIALVERVFDDLIGGFELADLALMLEDVPALLSFNLLFPLLLLPGALFSARMEERFNFVVLVIELELLLIHVGVPLTELNESFVSITLSIGSVALLLRQRKLILVVSIIVVLRETMAVVLRLKVLRRGVHNVVIVRPGRPVKQVRIGVRPELTLLLVLAHVLLLLEGSLCMAPGLLVLPLLLLVLEVAVGIEARVTLELLIQVPVVHVRTDLLVLQLGLALHFPQFVSLSLLEVVFILVLVAMAVSVDGLFVH